MKGILVLISVCFLHTFAMDNLRVAFQWKQLDFEYPTEEDRGAAIDSEEFIPENNLPLGLEVYGNRLFITVPRWKKGVPASLTYINLTDPNQSPKLHPYPDWASHKKKENNTRDIISPFRIRADRCGRLWVLDTGLEEILSESPVVSRPTRIIIYNLTTDEKIRDYDLPKDQMKQDSFFANIAVEDHDCEDTHAYIGDLGKPAIVVYSWKKNKSWRVMHNFFHIDPLAGELHVDGVDFIWTDGVFGLALSNNDSSGYSTLYFHPLTSTNEFSVSTKILRDEAVATSKEKYHEFKFLGSRGPRGQSGASFLDKKTNVLFYALINLNAVACWRITNPAYTMQSQGRVYMNNVTMVFPNDIKVDSDDNLWVLSDRLAKFAYVGLNDTEVNFRILTAPVREAIKGTACDPKFKPNPDMMEILKPGDKKDKKSSSSRISSSVLLIPFVVLIAILSNL